LRKNYAVFTLVNDFVCVSRHNNKRNTGNALYLDSVSASATSRPYRNNSSTARNNKNQKSGEQNEMLFKRMKHKIETAHVKSSSTD
jgi:hypothetical protein